MVSSWRSPHLVDPVLFVGVAQLKMDGNLQRVQGMSAQRRNLGVSVWSEQRISIPGLCSCHQCMSTV
jgi:cytochrome c peroxidase